MNRHTKLPVWRTAIGAYSFLFANWRDAVRIGWLPVVVAMTLDFLLHYLPSGDGWPKFALVLYSLAIRVAYSPVIAIAVVPWHRYILLNRRVRGGAFAVSLSAREGRYVELFVAIMLIGTGMSWGALLAPVFLNWIAGPESVVRALLSTTGFFLYLAVVVATLYVFSVLCLALPAVAIDQGAGLRGAVELSYGNGWRIVLVILAAVAPCYVFYWISSYLAEPVFETTRGIARAAVDGVSFIFEALLVATALSLCYRALGGLHGSKPGPTVIPTSGQT